MEDDIENEPELATNIDWRNSMIEARQTKTDDYPDGMSQKQLADLVGCSQVMISKIEDADRSSKYIRRICRVLHIELPQHFVDERARRWSELGRLISHRDPDSYKIHIAQLELEAKRLEERDKSTDKPNDLRK